MDPNQINPNGQNAIFRNEDSNILYSWCEGQLQYEIQISYREIAYYIWGLNYRIYDLRDLDRMIRYNYYVIGNYGSLFIEKM